ncbi:uncharacterized protein DSM5745_08396 [Aspergillus mulundensis]|uniref:LysM domain-containing protein n=1 Tax=Aspergillus mulundensis TaxID=1810919 RepID=A0A3D8RA26_9EURO|nr:hypothetical protein DSM5745_08396 [Aspergillus mulundensis]RDW70885.1 hypothetical protein DSM5745_08396 [Aspergillus mulundensis]
MRGLRTAVAGLLVLVDSARAQQLAGTDSITSYPNTVTSATFSSVDADIPTATSDPGFIYTPPPLPSKAPGTISDCYEYDATSFDDVSCYYLALDHNVPFADLVEWNPSLENNQVSCTLSSAYSYCVKKYENSTVTDNETMCLSIEATEDGTASNCNCFTYVNSHDEGDMTCEDILDTFDISLGHLLAWNTWLAEGECTTALFANIPDYEDRSVLSSIARLITPIRRRLTPPVYIPRLLQPSQQSAHFSTTTTARGRALPIAINGELQMSNRTPDGLTAHNAADTLERLMEADGFRKWGFAIYRCTYESDAEWDAFMTRLYDAVTELLELGNGLDILESFAPTVIEDPSFAGATTATLREHFRSTWVPSAFADENPRLSPRILSAAEGGRYRFFIMVDRDSLESVLQAPGEDEGINRTGYVRLVRGEWEPQEREGEGEGVSEDGDEEDELVPLEGSTAEDVGWMNVVYDDAQLTAYLKIQCDWDFEDHYERPPAIRMLE